jgi:plastocyanin
MIGRMSPCRFTLGVAMLTGMALFSVLALASQIHRVVQHGRAFNVGEIAIAAGDTVEFSDEDEFIHQIFIQSLTMNFDSAEQSPGQVIAVPFPSAGSFEVHCHIHPKMYLKVNVR